MLWWRQVIKVVAPKRAALAEAEAAYEVVMVGLRAKQYELQVGLSSPCVLQLMTCQRTLRQQEITLCSWHPAGMSGVCSKYLEKILALDVFAT